MMRWAAAGLAVLAAGAALPAAAAGHGESSPLIRSVVDRVEPSVPGVHFTPVRGTASLLNVVNTTDQDLEVLAPTGEPFLRIGPRGAYGNRASPYWHASGNPDGQTGPRAPTRPGPRPRWTLLARERAWAYYEHRLHPGQIQLPARARGTRRVMRLLDFAIEYRHGARPGRLRGHLEFRPVLGRVGTALVSSSRPLPGVTLTVLEGRFPGLLIRSSARTPVTVEGRAGEPFLRLSARGAEVNLRSPTHVDDRRARGERVAAVADARAAPRWRRVAHTPSYMWLESRARYAPEQPPDSVARAERPALLQRWSVPVRAGARRVEVSGTATWLPTGASGLPLAAEPPRRGTPAGWWIAGGLGALVVLGVAARLRFARGRRGVPRPSPR